MGTIKIKRPKVDDEEVIVAALKMHEKEIAAHDLDEQILIASYHPFCDGFEWVKELESRFGYSGSMSLAEFLDGLSSAIYWQRDKAVKRWVKEQGIKPKLSVGDKFNFIEPYEFEGAVMEIVGIAAEVACYAVQSKGHERYPLGGTTRRLLTFEEVECLPLIK